MNQLVPLASATLPALVAAAGDRAGLANIRNLHTRRTSATTASGRPASPDLARRQIWNEWASQHPRLSLPGGPILDDGPPSPAEVTVMVLTALRATEDGKRNLQRSCDAL